MICLVSKWLISGAIDSRKAIPEFLRPHLNRCAACRDFINLSQTFEKRAAHDAQLIINETPGTLQEKVNIQPLVQNEQNKKTWINNTTTSLF